MLLANRCSDHDALCSFPQSVDIDISGTPCVGSSTRGKLLGGNDPSSSSQFLPSRISAAFQGSVHCLTWNVYLQYLLYTYCKCRKQLQPLQHTYCTWKIVLICHCFWRAHDSLTVLDPHVGKTCDCESDGVRVLMRHGIVEILYAFQTPLKWCPPQSDSKLRLAYFYGAFSKIRVLENVTTGEIGDLTESVLAECWEYRKIVTMPRDT